MPQELLRNSEGVATASHQRGDATLSELHLRENKMRGLDIYLKRFKPSKQLDHPYAMLGMNVVADSAAMINRTSLTLVLKRVQWIRWIDKLNNVQSKTAAVTAIQTLVRGKVIVRLKTCKHLGETPLNQFSTKRLLNLESQ